MGLPSQLESDRMRKLGGGMTNWIKCDDQVSVNVPNITHFKLWIVVTAPDQHGVRAGFFCGQALLGELTLPVSDYETARKKIGVMLDGGCAF